jgi:hypothetical protein
MDESLQASPSLPDIQAKEKSLLDPAPKAAPVPKQKEKRQREKHIMTDSRLSALKKARTAKKVKSEVLKARAQEQSQMVGEMKEMMKEMRNLNQLGDTTIRELQGAIKEIKSFQLSERNHPVMNAPPVQEVQDHLPRADTGPEDPPAAQQFVRDHISSQGFKALAAGRVSF